MKPIVLLAVLIPLAACHRNYTREYVAVVPENRIIYLTNPNPFGMMATKEKNNVRHQSAALPR